MIKLPQEKLMPRLDIDTFKKYSIKDNTYTNPVPDVPQIRYGINPGLPRYNGYSGHNSAEYSINLAFARNRSVGNILNYIKQGYRS